MAVIYRWLIRFSLVALPLLTACTTKVPLLVLPEPIPVQPIATVIPADTATAATATIAEAYDEESGEPPEDRTATSTAPGMRYTTDLSDEALASRWLNDPAALGTDQNRAIKILNVQDDREGHLLVTFQALRRLDWQNTAYQGTLRDQADVMVEFFDAQGLLLATARIPARKTQGGDDVMNAGQVGVHKIPKPLNTASHRVWVAP